MIHDGRVTGLPLVDYRDTKANVEALAGCEEGMTAYANDTNQLGVYNGSVWRWSSLGIDTHRQSLVSTLWGTISAALTWTGAQIYQAATTFQEVVSIAATKAASLLTVNQSGTGDITEFQDGGTATVRIPDQGGIMLVGQAGGTQALTGLLYYDNTILGFRRLKFWHEEHNYPVPLDPRNGFRNVPVHTTFP